MLQNLHTHSTFCDGKSTPEELVEKAIELKFDSLGFSSHSVTTLHHAEEIYDVKKYISDISALKKKYEGKIKIYLGCEIEEFSYRIMDNLPFDYTIGAVHYGIHSSGEEVCFDFSRERTKGYIDSLFGGDPIEYAKFYYDCMINSTVIPKCSFVAHFDLLTKFSEADPSLIDLNSTAYKNVALEALHAVKEKNEFFEVNTGAMSRGYRQTPYPQSFILDEMKNIGCKLILSSDCHHKDALNCGFDTSLELIKSHGFTELYYLTDNGFVGEKI